MPAAEARCAALWSGSVSSSGATTNGRVPRFASSSSPPARAPTCRRSSTGCTAAMGSRWSAVASDKPGARALERAARRRASRRPSSRAADYADRAARDAAMADWLEAARGRPDRPRRLHAAAHRRASCARFRNRIVNVHPALLPSFPGLDAIGPGARARRAGHRGDGPLRRRGGRLRADHPAAGDRGAYTRDRAAAGGRRSTAVEHELLPEAIRMIAAGRSRGSTRQSATRHVDRGT